MSHVNRYMTLIDINSVTSRCSKINSLYSTDSTYLGSNQLDSFTYPAILRNKNNSIIFEQLPVSMATNAVLLETRSRAYAKNISHCQIPN